MNDLIGLEKLRKRTIATFYRTRSELNLFPEFSQQIRSFFFFFLFLKGKDNNLFGAEDCFRLFCQQLQDTSWRGC